MLVRGARIRCSQDADTGCQAARSGGPWEPGLRRRALGLEGASALPDSPGCDAGVRPRRVAVRRSSPGAVDSSHASFTGLLAKGAFSCPAQFPDASPTGPPTWPNVLLTSEGTPSTIAGDVHPTRVRRMQPRSPDHEPHPAARPGDDSRRPGDPAGSDPEGRSGGPGKALEGGGQQCRREARGSDKPRQRARRPATLGRRLGRAQHSPAPFPPGTRAIP